MMRRWIPIIVVTLVFGGCKKKEESQGTPEPAAPTAPEEKQEGAAGRAAAPAATGSQGEAEAPPAGSAEAQESGAQAAPTAARTPVAIPEGGAAAAEAAAQLPPGAGLYMQVDVKQALAAEVISAHKAEILADISEPCRPVLDSVEHLLMGAYGEGENAFPFFAMPRHDDDEPFDPRMVFVVTGPTTEAILGCVEAEMAGEEEAVGLKRETRGGREVVVGGEHDEITAFTASDTVHVVVVGPSMVDAALAAADGGESLAGGPVVGVLQHVPAAPVLFSFAIGDEMNEMIGEMMGRMGMGDIAAAPPSTYAASIGFDAEDLVAVAAMVLESEDGAKQWEEIGRKSIATAKQLMGVAAQAEPLIQQMLPVLDTVAFECRGPVLLAGVRLPLQLFIYAFMMKEEHGKEQPAESSAEAPPSDEPATTEAAE